MARKPKTEEPATVTEETAADTTAPETTPVETKVEGPVALVKRILAEQRALDPNVSRAAVIKACTDAGCNLHTAKTQYQRHYRSV